MCNENFEGARARILMKNIAYVGVLAALLDIDLEVIKELLEETFASKPHLIDSNMQAIRLGYDYASEHFPCPLPKRVETMDETKGHIVIDGNTAAGLGCVYAGATVGAWYPITPSTSLMDAFRTFCARYRVDPETGQANLLHHPGRRRAGRDRHGAGRQLERCALVHADQRSRHFADERVHRLGYYAEIPAVIFNVQRTGPSTGMPTRTQQCDLMSCAYASHGDTKHVLLFPADPRSVSTWRRRRSILRSGCRRPSWCCPISTSA